MFAVPLTVLPFQCAVLLVQGSSVQPALFALRATCLDICRWVFLYNNLMQMCLDNLGQLLV